MRISRLAVLAALLIAVAAGTGLVVAKDKCATIQSGAIIASNGDVVEVGFDKYGYNYQAHIFNGYYDNYSRPAEPVSTGDRLIMKWNDAWLSNKDCDGDRKLDRPSSYIGSGAWVTNHISWVENGQENIYFVKIIAVPETAEKVDDIWYSEDGVEIGPSIWGSFAIIQEVQSGEGVFYHSPAGPGLGTGHIN